MNILGINSFFEQPSVALLMDGQLVFAIEDERLTRVKHGRVYTPYSPYLPYDSIYAALKFANLKATDINKVAYSYSRSAHLKASITSALGRRRMKSLSQEIAAYRTVGNVQRELVENHTLSTRFSDRWQDGDFAGVDFREWKHHLTHAASAFFCSGFERALVVVADGRGEKSCTSIYLGNGSNLTKIDSIDLPHSLGFLYSHLTYHLGFQPFGDEYKVMGLSAYGRPAFMDQMAELVTLEPNGRYRTHVRGADHLTAVFGDPRAPKGKITQAHKDIAHSLQAMFEIAIQHVVAHHVKATGERRVCVAGGTFYNCVSNAKLARMEGVDESYLHPAAGEAGTAIGAAALSWIEAGGAPQIQLPSMLLGTEWSDDEIKAALQEARLPYRQVGAEALAEETAKLLHEECVVAFFQDRMEFGPRALGARSFLASARSTSTREKLNVIKGREQFRPLAPLVLDAYFDTYFDGVPNAFMMMAVKAREATRQNAPAVVHADGTSRVQVVKQTDNALLYEVLEAYARKSGVPILINTSLNVRGKPIDESPVDALASAVPSGVEALVIGSFIVDLRSMQA